MLEFKTDRIKGEYNELPQRNPKLLTLLNAGVAYVEHEFKKDVVVTEIYRSKEEFDALYAATPVDRRPKSSPHCYWGAFDLRSTLYDAKEIERLVNFFNQWVYKDGSKKTCLYHCIAGNAPHMHIQA